MVNPASTAHSDVSTALRELAWAIHRTAPERAGVGPIPTTEIALLKQVIDNPGSTVGDLAAALGLQQPNVSTAIRVLVARGFITREKSEEDRRVSLLFPTPLGVSEHTAISEAWSSPVDAALEELSAKQRAALDAATEAIVALHQSLRRASTD
ncbi:MarR family winged helix-turn-helix transcriptional regulator [Microbacterium murale]|uniref:MarR family transcriptional regulator n=1 Tax=Microbacterium murale TaxID=1081040 RepID=A0ABQ1RHK4_9MICO|nr:MarR family winged helix-turn-helix transcriptional regulator [Microbacterium murale]GGD70567.1 MarR family transcriptional regulator [Microbacterium murale]